MQKYSVRTPLSKNEAVDLNDYPDLIKHLLYHRGITTKAEAQSFLNPDYENGIHDPFLMKDMDKAVDRILQAIDKKEKIVIYSDYDADGIPGGVIMHDFLKKIGYDNFINYFPHRHDEGYGLHIEAINKFYDQGITLVMTIDCGTTDNIAIERAVELGMDVIVTDHHISSDVSLPPAYAVVNPKRNDCDYPYEMLCGSGIVFKIIQGLISKRDFGLKKGFEKWFLDMVGFATIADMVPLRGENRIFAYYGLKVLRKTQRNGLKKLMNKAKIKLDHLYEEDIGFTLAPRINAASRMGKPSEAFELLTTNDEVHAEKMSDYLQKINDERKSISASMTKEVKKFLNSRSDSEKDRKVLVFGNPKWQPSLVGPVCNNLMEECQSPVFVWGRGSGEYIKGSCRSNGSVSVVDLMKSVPKDTFISYGGHKMSGGFSISHDKIHFLEQELCTAYNILLKEKEYIAPDIFIDQKLSLDDVNWSTYSSIDTLAPFGIDNPRPTFLFEGIEIYSVKAFGKEKNHLELTFKNSYNKSINSIGFFMTEDDFASKIKVGEKINLVASIEKSVFKNYPELRLRIIDII